MCSILQVPKEFPSMVWLSLLLVMSLSHSTVGRSGIEVIHISCIVKLVLMHCHIPYLFYIRFFSK